MGIENATPDTTVILSIVASVLVTLLGNWILSRADNKRVPTDIRNKDSETYRNLLATTEEATQALKDVRAENAKVLKENDDIKKENVQIKGEYAKIKEEYARIIEMLSGKNRMTFEFSLADLVNKGEADILSGKVVSMEKE